MPRWNEDEALELFTPTEWEFFARLAHQLGWERAEEIDEAEGEDAEEERGYSREQVQQEAQAALKGSALLAPHRDSPLVRLVFERNFGLGWKCYEANGCAHEEPEYPGQAGR